MAGSTQRTKLTLVSIIFGMTGRAILRRTFEDTVLMAILTGYSSMLTIKVKRKLRVIYVCQAPTFGRVTSGAICSKLTIVVIILRMT